MACDHHMVSLGLGHARRHRADADFGYQLDRNRRLRIGVFQIMNQLRQVLDRINIMLRRRRNQTHHRDRETQQDEEHGTKRPGSWPPSPGLAPCAILIWICSADTRYSVVTPKRPDATCLIFERSASPSSNGISTSTRSWPMTDAKLDPFLIGIPRNSLR